MMSVKNSNENINVLENKMKCLEEDIIVFKNQIAKKIKEEIINKNDWTKVALQFNENVELRKKHEKEKEYLSNFKKDIEILKDYISNIQENTGIKIINFNDLEKDILKKEKDIEKEKKDIKKREKFILYEHKDKFKNEKSFIELNDLCIKLLKMESLKTEYEIFFKEYVKREKEIKNIENFVVLKKIDILLKAESIENSKK